MAGKNTLFRRIDAKLSQEKGETFDSEILDYAPLSVRSVQPPEDLILDSSLIRSAITAETSISATWSPPNGISIDQYIAQISEDNTFPENATRTFYIPGDQLSIAILALKTNTLYYVHIAAVSQASVSDYTDYVSETTPNDTIAPNPVSSASYDFTSGDLLLSWINPLSDNFRHTRVDIYASNGGTHLHTFNTADTHYTYLASQNLVDTSNIGDPSLYVTLTSVSWFGVDGSSVNLSPVKSAPSTPTSLITSWDSDSGTAGPDLKIKWTAGSYIDHYILTLDGVARTLGGITNQYIYTLDANRSEHSGTPDKTITIALTAYDALKQANTIDATANAVNASPIAPTVGSVVGATQLYAYVSSTPAGDFDVNEFVWKNSLGSTIQTTLTQGASDTLQITSTDTYSVTVRVRDVFGSYSTGTLISSLFIEALTLTIIREDSTYSDSISTDFSSNPNKTVLKDDTTGAGITYTASASAYKYTKITYQFIERFRRISLRLGSGTANFYIGISSDDVTYTWYSGSVVSGYILTSVVNEAAAQAAAPLFSALTYGYVELPTTVEGRFIKIFHRNTTLSYRLDEGYGQTLIIADVIKAGDIQTIHLAVGSVIADRISVTNLSAISADLGSITAGTVTGATIRTAASGARLQLTSNAFEGYTASDKFFQIEPTDGITIYANSTLSTIRAYTFRTSALTLMGGLYGIEDTLTRAMELSVVATTKGASMSISSEGLNSAGTGIQASSSAGEADIQVGSDSVFGNTIDLNADKTTVSAHITILGGLNLAGATSAGIGKIRSNQYTLGSVLFQGASNEFSQDNSNFFWDDTNNRLGIGNAAPSTTLHITGTIKATVGLTLDFITAGSVLFGGASGVVSQDNTNLFWDDTNNKLFIGNNAQGNGMGMLVLTGTDSSGSDGPNIELLTASDAYPIIQLLGFAHDSNYINFDAYLNSSLAWKSSDAGSNFQIRKGADQFGIWGASGVSAGNTITWLANDLMETTGVRSIIVNSAITNTVAQHQFYHRTSGTPAASFGLDIITNLSSATVADRNASLQRTTWTTATDASRKALEQWFIYDTSPREAFRIAGSGTAPQIGFLGANASARIAVSAAAPANGAGITAGAFDTAAHRDALITLVNDLRTVLITNGLAV